MRAISLLNNNNERHYSKSTYCVINFRVYEKGLCGEKGKDVVKMNMLRKGQIGGVESRMLVDTRNALAPFISEELKLREK